MQTQRFAVLLSVVNLAILGFVLLRASGTAASAQTNAPQEVQILRGRALELVDERNQVRASIDVEASGDVLLRLRDERGTIRVKLGAGESGAALLLVDEATEPAVHLVARRNGTAERPTTTSMTLRTAQGQERVIRP